LISFSTKFSENLHNELKITKNSMGMGKFKPLEKKDLLKIAAIFGIIVVPLIFAFSISR
jgi:hypothetical protein